jgi:hypothetical protein
MMEFGEFLAPDEMVGKVFHTTAAGGRIRQEAMWFRYYLTYGQEAISARPLSSLPDICQIEGKPADKVWNSLLECSRQLGLEGENGGGVMFSSDQLDERKLALVVPRTSLEETDDGYLEP